MKQNLLYICVCLFISTQALSQINRDTIDIPEVKIIAKRPIEETGIKIIRLDTLILMKSINASLSDILSENTTVFVKTSGRGALATVSFRGTSPSHTDVLWNNISISSPMLGQVDFSLIPVYFIDDVSLLHGAGSIQNTSGALGGSISINNKPDWNNKFSGKFLQGFGSYNTYSDFLQINFGNKRFQTKTRAFYSFSKNNFKFKNKNIADIDTLTGKYIYPVQENTNAEYQQYGLLQEFYLRLKNNITASVKYWHQTSNRSLPRLNTYEGNDYSNISKQIDISNRLIAEISKSGERSKLGFTSGLILKDMTYSLKNFISGYNYENAIYSESNSISSYNKLFYKYKLSEKTYFNFNFSTNFHKVNTIDTITKTGYDTTRLEHLSFVSLNQKFGKRLACLVMLRKNFISSNSIPLIPYFGFDYLISDKHQFFLKGNIGKNYHFPSLNDLYWQPGGNPDILPENGISGDIGLSVSSKINNITIENSITGFYSDINNWIIWLPTVKGYWTPENISHVVSKGLEYNIKLNFSLGKYAVKTNANYAYTRSLNYGNVDIWGEGSYGKQLVYVPVHSGNIFVNISRNGYSVSYTHNSYSERFTTSTNNYAIRDWLYPYYMNNLFVGKNFKFKKFDLNIQFKIYNLFNEEYRSILFRPMPERNYLVLLGMTF